MAPHRLSILSSLLCIVLLSSCASAPTSGAAPYAASQPAAKAIDPAAPQAAPQADRAVTEGEVSSPQTPSNAPQAKPQLIKRASLSLQVETLSTALTSVKRLVQQQQGDILNLQQQTQPNDNQPRSASLSLRVPQAKLDASLDALAKLGTVQGRSLTAEDVSSQLVDYQARLKNLRKAEDMTLKIMDRSGSIKDVLAVSQELTNIRQSIEQIDGQLQSLKTQVAYSTIDLTLSEAIASNTPSTALGTEIQGSWQAATRSVGGFSRGLLKLGLWLLAYSPYLVLLAALIYGVRRLRTQRPTQTLPSPTSSPSGQEGHG